MTTTYEKASKYLRDLPTETLFSAAIRTAPQFVRDAVGDRELRALLSNRTTMDILCGTAHEVADLLAVLEPDALPWRPPSLQWRYSRGGVRVKLEGWVLDVREKTSEDEPVISATLTDPNGAKVFSGKTLPAPSAGIFAKWAAAAGYQLQEKRKLFLERIKYLLAEAGPALLFAEIQRHRHPQPQAIRHIVMLSDLSLGALSKAVPGISSVSDDLNLTVLQHPVLLEEAIPTLRLSVWMTACFALLKSSQPLWDVTSLPPHRAARLRIIRTNEAEVPDLIDPDDLETALYALSDAEWIGLLAVVQRVRKVVEPVREQLIASELGKGFYEALVWALEHCGARISDFIDDNDDDDDDDDDDVNRLNSENDIFWLNLDLIMSKTPVSPQALADVTRMTIIHDENGVDQAVGWYGCCFPGSGEAAARQFAGIFDSDIEKISWYEPKPLSE